MTTFVMVSLCIVAAILLASYRISKSAKRPAASARQSTRKPVASPYAAVSIHCGSDACASVMEINQKRYLNNDAPQFPLADCNSGKCECRYQRHQDRRDNHSGRRAPRSLVTDLYPTTGILERRMQTCRRAGDIQQEEVAIA
jgi:hypothetical protein